MGRGRAKAKQTKVARRLKYQTLGTDFDALQRELAGSEDAGATGSAPSTADDLADDEEDDGSPYAASASSDVPYDPYDVVVDVDDEPAPRRR